MNLAIRLGIIFGAFGLVVTFLICLSANIEKSIFIFRIFLNTIFFAILGFGLGYIIRNFIPELLKFSFKSRGDSRASQTVAVPGANNTDTPGEEIKVEESFGVPSNLVSTEEVKTKVPSAKAEAEPVKLNPLVDIPEDHKKELNKIRSNENLGEYMIIQDAKIKNDPEELAKAVRSMMNKE
jgi:hypothetical protein